MGEIKDEMNAESALAEDKKKAKSDVLIFAAGGALCVAIAIDYFSTNLVFLFALLLGGVHSHSNLLSFAEKIPAFSTVIVIAFLSFNTLGGDVGGSSYAIGGSGVEPVDGMTTGRSNNRDCTLVSLPGGQSMMSCD